MKPSSRHIIPFATALALIAGLAFVSCANDPEPNAKPEGSYLLHPVMGSVRSQVLGTRSGSFAVDGKGYEAFDEAYPTPIDPAYKTIGVFLAQTGSSSPTAYTDLYGTFQWQSGLYWSTDVSVVAGSEYYIYGFMPSNYGESTQRIDRLTADAEGNTIAGTWADGALMTYSNLPIVTGADVCAITGLKPGDSTKSPSEQYPITSLDLDWSNANQFVSGTTEVVPVLGNHRYKAVPVDNNCVYMLLNHLYSNINLEMFVDLEYSKLREIELTQVVMQASKPGTTGKINLSVPVYNQAPYLGAVNYEFIPTDDASTEVSAVQLFPVPPSDATVVVEPQVSEGEQHYTSIPGYFAPVDADQTFDFTFTYNVYDRKPDGTRGNLVRAGATATNHWNKTRALLEANGLELARGMSFQVKVLVKPTYLYQLSEPDLDNPAIEFN